MTEFLSIILTFPTLLYTGLLGFTLLYWLVSIMGLADFDFEGEDLDVDSFEVAENLENVDGSDVVDSSGFLSKFKLDGIPLTISISFVIFLSWIISFLVVYYYQEEVTDGWVKILVGVWVVILAPFVAAPIVGVLLSPLRPLFEKMKQDSEGRKANSLVGKKAVVRTSKVTMSFGDADITSDGASLILKIRAKEPNVLRRGDKVIITQYYPKENIYMVEFSK